MNNNLNVFKYGMFDRFNFHCIIHNIRQFFRNMKYAWQRATKGYCDQDIWNLFDFYTDLITTTIRQLEKNHVGYPGKEPWETSEEWEAFLTELTEHMNNASEDTMTKWDIRADEILDMPELDFTEHREELHECWEKAWEYRNTEKDLALDMLKKSWFNLWD